MGDKHDNTQADPEVLEHCQKGWDAFTVATKYSIIGVVVVLALMAAFLL